MTEQQNNAFEQLERDLKHEQDVFWNSLSKEDQLKAFCSVARRLVQAELVDKGSYRYTLYHVFGFGLESYLQAQLAGFLELHNSIYARDHDARLLQAIRKEILEQLPLRSGYSIYDGGYEDGKQCAIQIIDSWIK